jgi:hypothetical protein
VEEGGSNVEGGECRCSWGDDRRAGVGAGGRKEWWLGEWTLIANQGMGTIEGLFVVGDNCLPNREFKPFSGYL